MRLAVCAPLIKTREEKRKVERIVPRIISSRVRNLKGGSWKRPRKLGGRGKVADRVAGSGLCIGLGIACGHYQGPRGDAI